MDLFETEQFYYKEGELYCEGTPIRKIIEQAGSPTYVYSKNYFKKRYLEFKKAFSYAKCKIYYAVKSNFNLSVIKTFVELDSGLDVNSQGELYRALKAGAAPSNISFSGVGKTEEEIQYALENGIFLFKAESFEEAVVINKVAERMKKTPNVSFRINPDVNPETHPYISTGFAESKFGIDASEAEETYMKALDLKSIQICGIDMHIGSQIKTIDPFVEAVEKLSKIFLSLKAKGFNLKHLNMGGGMGSLYKDEKIFHIEELGNSIRKIITELDCELIIEPGRYLSANAGALICKILYLKKNRKKCFTIVDGAMNDLIRPAIYEAYHHIQPIKLNNKEEFITDVVGPICESGDFFAKSRKIEKIQQGDYLAVMSAGSYGMAMASNYNGRRRPAEVIVDGDQFYIARGRESFEYLIYDERA